jgi:hypothetical protein
MRGTFFATMQRLESRTLRSVAALKMPRNRPKRLSLLSEITSFALRFMKN